MKLFICDYCGSNRKSQKSLIGHETFCKENPNHKIQNTQLARQKALNKVNCKWCNNSYTLGNIRKHEISCRSNPDVLEKNSKTCPVCNIDFLGKSTTCSHSCSNKYFRHSKEGGFQYKTDDYLIENSRYRDICFRYHDKKCVICEEENIVAVHHLNENHDDNRPENLIPLCPTHHQYCHSNYKSLVEQTITEYIDRWKKINLSVGKPG